MPLPSGALLEVSDIDEHSDEALLLAAPHWNAAVRLLGQDGAGYRALLDLVEQVEGHLGKARSALQGVEQRVRGADMVIDLIKAEARGGERAEEHMHAHWFHPGPDATIRDTLGWPSPAPEAWDPPRRWRWDCADPDDLPHEDAHLYYEIEPTESSAWNGMRVPEIIRYFHVDDTWEEAARGVEWVRRSWIEESDRLNRVVETIQFRVTVLRQVQKEFELLGNVRYITPDEAAKDEAETETATAQARPKAVTRLQYTFLEKACELTTNAVQFNSLNDFFNQMSHELNDDPSVADLGNWYKGRPRRVARSLGLVAPGNKGNKPKSEAESKKASQRGKATRRMQRDALNSFKGELANWCTMLGEGMVKVSKEE